MFNNIANKCLFTINEYQVLRNFLYITLNFLFGMKFDTRVELLELRSNKFYLNQINSKYKVLWCYNRELDRKRDFCRVTFQLSRKEAFIKLFIVFNLN